MDKFDGKAKMYLQEDNAGFGLLITDGFTGVKMKYRESLQRTPQQMLEFCKKKFRTVIYTTQESL